MSYSSYDYYRIVSDHYRDILNNLDNECVILIDKSDNEYKINKYILKLKSNYFKTLFDSSICESTNKSIKLDLDEKDTKILIDHFNDKLIINKKNVISAYEVAEYFGCDMIIENIKKKNHLIFNKIYHNHKIVYDFIDKYPYFKEMLIEYIYNAINLIIVYSNDINKSFTILNYIGAEYFGNVNYEYKIFKHISNDIFKSIINNKILEYKKIFLYIGLQSNLDEEIMINLFDELKDKIDWIKTLQDKHVVSIIFETSIYNKFKEYIDNKIVKSFIKKNNIL